MSIPHRDLHLPPQLGEILRRHGLNPERLLHENVGDSVSVSRLHDVRRLDFGGDGVFYLKRREGESRWRMIGLLARGRRPHAGPVREGLMATQLRDAGFRVMEAAAWGEIRRFGLPVRGFLLVREVSGEDVATLYDRSDGRARRHLMERVGELTGRLHAAGFLHPVRLKDLIRAPDGELVLIDRETGKPWRGQFRPGASVVSLARAARRTLRDGHRIGPGSAVAFFRGYRRGLGRPAPTVERWTAALRRELG